MTNPHGTPIWYELASDDPDAAKAFYDAVAGWTVEARPSGDMDYRMIGAADGENVGGVMRLTPAMRDAGARPGWLFYIGVDDVDATVAALRAHGGAVHRDPWDIPGIGRMAVVADPQGAPFYVMRGATDGAASSAFAPTATGHASWNELATGDPDAALAFYGALFGWRSTEQMAMGAMGDYRFLDAAAGRLGAVWPAPPGVPPHWRFYFRVGDVDAAAVAIGNARGRVVHGPADVPNGDRIVVAEDPEGAGFGLVCAQKG